jgi:hypothetical protein
LVPLHAWGRHDCSIGSGQRPSPEQTLASVATFAVQLAALHWTLFPGYAQLEPSLPLQVPLQAEPSLVQAVRAPCGKPVTGVQTPSLPWTSHASHCPVHALLQQKPSTQTSAMHALPPGQGAPWPPFGTQMPAEQKLSRSQSLSTAQSLPHAVPAHAPPQSWLNSGGHAPAPLQNAATVATPASQLASRHEVPEPG